MVVATPKANKQALPSQPDSALDQGFELLGLSPLDQAEKEQITTRIAQLEQTLAGFKVKARVRLVQVGPTVTTYGLALEPGVKVSLVRGLEADLSLALGLRAVRLEIPMPNTNFIGVEVANQRRRWVGLDEVLNSSKFREFTGALKMPMGVDNTGGVVIADLAALPHLMVAGRTDSGKSAFLSSLIAGWTTGLYQPDELKLVLIDPKQVEFAKFSQAPHLYLPVITHLTQSQALATAAFTQDTTANSTGQSKPQPQDLSGLLNAITVLGWLVAEMRARYRRLAAAGVNKLASYNRLVDRLNHQQHEQHEEQQVRSGRVTQELEKLPRLVIIIDEIADLMAVIEREAEAKAGGYYLRQLLNMGRAAGIHLILATQYPSREVLPGEIKSQIPGRVCFSVSREVDSRVVLDMSGAEGLLGRGDMLARLGGAAVSASNEIEQGQNASPAGAGEQSDGGELIRVQSVFINDAEISRRLGALYGNNQGNAASNQAEELAATIARLAALPLPTLSDLALEMAASNPAASSNQGAQAEIDGEGNTKKEPGESRTTNRKKSGRRAGDGSSSGKAQVVSVPQPQVLVLPPVPASKPAPIPPAVSSMIRDAAHPGKSGGIQEWDYEQAHSQDQATERVTALEQALAQERSRARELEKKLADSQREVDSLRQQIETVSRLKVTLDSGAVLPLPAALAQAQLDTLKVGQLVVDQTTPSNPNPARPTTTTIAGSGLGLAPDPTARGNTAHAPNPNQAQSQGRNQGSQPPAGSGNPRYQAQTDRAYQTVMAKAEKRKAERVEELLTELAERLNRLPLSDRKILLFLHRHAGAAYSIEELAGWLGYETVTLANRPPNKLVGLKLVECEVENRKVGRRYRNVQVYSSRLGEYLKENKDLASVDPKQVLARLKGLV